MSVQILQGDVRLMLATLPAESVQVCVTSPPYFNLRDYGVDGQIGLEATPSEFVATLVEVFDGVRRVLRPDGVCFVNLGDSYSGSGKGGSALDGSSIQTGLHSAGMGQRAGVGGIPPKNLLLIPERFAIAMQDAGWYVRSRIAWCKTSAMPESVKDRPTSAWEHIFMFTKSQKYFYDAEAVRGLGSREAVQRLPGSTANQQFLSEEGPRQSTGSPMSCVQCGAPAETEGVPDSSGMDGELPQVSRSERGTGEVLWLGEGFSGEGEKKPQATAEEARDRHDANRRGVAEDSRSTSPRLPVLRCDRCQADTGSRHPDQQGRSTFQRERRPVLSSVQQQEEGQGAGGNLRNFWLLGPEPSRLNHYAAFPSEIPRRCILAATSEKGQCPVCGAPWVRVVERGNSRHHCRPGCGHQNLDFRDGWDGGKYGGFSNSSNATNQWQPSCQCDAGDPVPQIVLDPFLGSGTTALVADQLQRNAVGIELNPKYAEIARRRITNDAPMFADVSVSA
jgi:DNA modification methylase